MVIEISFNKVPDIKVFKGSSRNFTFRLYDNQNKLISLTGSETVTMDIIDEVLGTNGSVTKTITGTVLNAGRSEINFNMSTSDLDITAGYYNYFINVDDNVFSGSNFIVLGDDTERIAQIRKNKSLRFEEYILENALQQARKDIKEYCFITENIEQRGTKSEFKLPNFVADSNFDGIIDKDDIIIYEFQRKSPYGINQLNSNITNFIPNHPSGDSIIIMDSNYPSDSSYDVIIEYHRCSDSYDKIKQTMLNLEELYVMKYLMSNLEPYQLQAGMTRRTVNGETLEFNQQAVREYQKELEAQILREKLNIKPFESKSVTISKGY